MTEMRNLFNIEYLTISPVYSGGRQAWRQISSHQYVAASQIQKVLLMRRREEYGIINNNIRSAIFRSIKAKNN